jgi:hypothetical protein
VRLHSRALLAAIRWKPNDMFRRAEHVARMAARIEELEGLGMTQAANEKRPTLLALRKVLAAERERLRNLENK